jgi:hypothetical protein
MSSSNQRSELNNQTDNGANEKWNPGAKGKTTDGPMDHTYPARAAEHNGQEDADRLETQQSGMGPGMTADGSSNSGASLPGGSLQTQQTGGTGAVKGVTDSHQRAMEERSPASGQLEQPVGGRPGSGTSLGEPQSATPLGTHGGGQQGPQTPQSPRAQRQGGSMGNRQNATPSGTQGGGQRGPLSEAPRNQQSTDRSGSQTGAGHRQGAPEVHESNDAAGGLPKSPGGANHLAADQKMDDDTGLSNTVNQPGPIDDGSKQAQQSNVGRRDDMTPD